MCAQLSAPTLRIDRLSEGLEIAVAANLAEAFRPHQHDCYVLGLTVGGVQSFRYRGTQRNARPGQAFAIHPGETHDGRPGTESGYGYRAAYISPDAIAEALETTAVPFVSEAVGQNAAFVTSLKDLFATYADGIDDIAVSDCTSALADAIAAMSDVRYKHSSLPDRAVALRLRDDLVAHAVTGKSMRALEREHDLSRFTICRVFRRHFGVSPQRFLTHRRVSIARSRIAKGSSLIDAADAAGFADSKPHDTALC